ncbi:MAG: potassium transporter [Alphaproteobacteria bacterium]|nr:potassium transporter [Alphaproteobacteria bacterium]
MEHASPLLSAFVYLAAAVISVPLAKRLGLGSVLGYLIAGAVIGPFGLHLLGDPQSVMHVAEFGVVIMLFLIGMEVQPALLWRLRGAIIGLGAGQVVSAGLALGAIALAFGLDWRTALVVGFILSLSSTAIVLQTLRERGLDASPPGRASFAVLLFQDIAVIPMLALLPLLAHGPSSAATPASGALAAAPAWVAPIAIVGAVGLVIVAGRLLVRPMFRFIAKSGQREIFTATALALVVGVAVLMQAVGLSPALGAFVAGVVLADSEFRREIEADIEPFRGLLLGLFFISVGASVDFALILAQPLVVVGLAVLLVAVKAGLMTILARLARRSTPDALMIGFGLAQGGEFAFVLAAFATQVGALGQATSSMLVAVVALSMAMTPILFFAADAIGRRFATTAPEKDMGPIESDDPDVVIAGFGRFGQVVGRLLIANGFETSVLDVSADQVEMLRGFGQKTNYGDATRIDLLRAAGADKAKILVIAIDDQEKALELAEQARRHFPHLKVLARAYDRGHAYELMRREVHGVERETFEGGVKLGVKALELLGKPAHFANRAGGLFRRHDERLLVEMSKHWGDMDAYRAAVRGRQGMVEDLMKRDLKTFTGARIDPAWDTTSLDAEARAQAPKSNVD